MLKTAGAAFLCEKEIFDCNYTLFRLPELAGCGAAADQSAVFQCIKLRLEAFSFAAVNHADGNFIAEFHRQPQCRFAVERVMRWIYRTHPFPVPFERVLVVERETGLKNVQQRHAVAVIERFFHHCL